MGIYFEEAPGDPCLGTEWEKGPLALGAAFEFPGPSQKTHARGEGIAPSAFIVSAFVSDHTSCTRHSGRCWGYIAVGVGNVLALRVEDRC